MMIFEKRITAAPGVKSNISRTTQCELSCTRYAGETLGLCPNVLANSPIVLPSRRIVSIGSFPSERERLIFGRDPTIPSAQ